MDVFSRTLCSVWLASAARSVNYLCWGVSLCKWFLQCSPSSSQLLCVLHESPTLCYGVWFCSFIYCTQTLILGLPVLYRCSYEWLSGSDLASENVSLCWFENVSYNTLETCACLPASQGITSVASAVFCRIITACHWGWSSEYMPRVLNGISSLQWHHWSNWRNCSQILSIVFIIFLWLILHDHQNTADPQVFRYCFCIE